MTPRIFLVLKSGGEYTLKHVEAIARQLKEHGPAGYELHLLTDLPLSKVDKVVDVVHAMNHRWPGWWAKMELFRFEGSPTEPVLYLDLDSIVLGDLWPLLHEIVKAPGLTALADFYRPQNLGSGLMGWASDLKWMYEAFAKDVRGIMDRAGRHGDQAALQMLLGTKGEAYTRWQDKLPREIISYKVHVRGQGNPPPGSLVCCFHGKPRPWEVSDAWAKEWFGE